MKFGGCFFEYWREIYMFIIEKIWINCNLRTMFNACLQKKENMEIAYIYIWKLNFMLFGNVIELTN